MTGRLRTALQVSVSRSALMSAGGQGHNRQIAIYAATLAAAREARDVVQ